jgi:hypothetical protein
LEYCTIVPQLQVPHLMRAELRVSSRSAWQRGCY